MEVAFLTTLLARGGAETQMVRLALGLKRRGWDVGVLTMLPSTAFAEEVREAGIPLAECGSGAVPGLPAMAARIYATLLSWRPRALVTFNTPADLAGRVCGRLAGIGRIIATLRTSNLESRLRDLLVMATEPLVERTVSNTQASLDTLCAQGILTPARTQVIPNGLPLEPFGACDRAAARRALDVPESAFLWTAVGNLTEAKDYPTLLAAAPGLAAFPGDARVLVAGDGPGLETLRRAAAEGPLGARFRFLGRRGDIPALLAAADGFVLCSAWEGLPNAVMEAMASRLPVVTTRVGGVAELVEPGATGWIVPPRDPAALAEAMRALMEMDPARRRALGEAGRAKLEGRFGMERVLDQWEALLRG